MNHEKEAKKISEGLYEWEPGNGTLYRIALTDTGDGKLFTWLRNAGVGGPSFLMRNMFDKSMSVDYFMEKSQVTREDDARACLRFLQSVGVINEVDE